MSKEAMKLALEEMKIGNYNSAAERLEAALADQPAQQEPVAWICYGSNNKHDIDFFEDDIADLAVGTKLYTQAQRTWVGLTDEEVFAVSNTMPYGDRFYFAEAIEAKLKEKNGG